MDTEALNLFTPVAASGPPGVLVVARVFEAGGPTVTSVACRVRYRVTGTSLEMLSEPDPDPSATAALHEVLGEDVVAVPKLLAGAPDVGEQLRQHAPRAVWSDAPLVMNAQRVAADAHGQLVVDYLVRADGPAPSDVRVVLKRDRAVTSLQTADPAMAWPFQSRGGTSAPGTARYAEDAAAQASTQSSTPAPPTTQTVPTPVPAAPVPAFPSSPAFPSPALARPAGNVSEPAPPPRRSAPPPAMPRNLSQPAPAPPNIGTTPANAAPHSAILERSESLSLLLPRAERAGVRGSGQRIAPAERVLSSPSPSHRAELLWTGDDGEVLARARRWVEEGSDRPRRALRRGARAVARPTSHAWFADGRSATAEGIAIRSIYDGSQPALVPPALVVRGSLTVDAPIADELAAVRTALSVVAPRHAPVREALDASAALEPSALTADKVVRAALDQLYVAARLSGMRPESVRDNALSALARARRHAVLTVFGDEHVVVRIGADPHRVVAYLPKAAAAHLPLDRSFDVRAVVAVHPRQDPLEKDEIALRICALARVHTPDAA